MRLKVSNVCQLYDKTYPATQTVNGVTFTNNGDGSVTVNGTASNTAKAEGEFLHVNPGDKILMFSGYDITGLKTAFVYCSQWDENKKWIADLGYPSLNGGISTCRKNCRYIRYTYRVDTGNTATNAVIKLQLFNLTEMYGAGNEPTTVEQFRQDFPNEMYDYSPVCWKKFRRLKYVTETKNLFKFSNEVGTLTGGFGPNVARNFEEGKWYIGFTTNNYYSPNNIIAYSFKDNLIYNNGNGAGYGLSRAFKCEPNSNYYISCLTIGISGSGLGYINAGFYDESGNYISHNNTDINSRSFTTPANCKWLIIVLSPRGTAEVYFKDIQVEKGSTASPYQPYGYLPLNRGKYIANKEPVQLLDKSNYEVTSTLFGITWTNNGDGTVTANGNVVSGTPYSPYRIYIPQFREVKNNHKYALFSGIDNINAAYAECLFWLGKSDGYFIQNCVETNIAGTFGFTIPQGEYLSYQKIELRVRDNYTANNLVFKPQLFDLTAMYGAGNEPATVEQFRADFPNELYDYNPYNAITFR